MIVQIQSDEPVVTLKESEYFKLKHIEEAVADKLKEHEVFLTAVVKELGILKGVTVQGGGNLYMGEFRIPGYNIHIKTDRVKKDLHFIYEKLPEK
jgi:hypothetical protein